MCLAIYKPATTKPDWDAYRNGFDSNPHGWGFAVIDNGELLDCVGIGNFDEFRHNFEPFSDKQAIIHFRWATHGTRGTENCHPFVHGGLAMIHNGIVDISTKDEPSRSDTYHFMQKVVVPMYERDPDFFQRDEVVYTMELAHRGSKFVFLREDGTFGIWNKEDGIEESDGHWYSNSGYEADRWAYVGKQGLWGKGDTCKSSASNAIAVITGTTDPKEATLSKDDEFMIGEPIEIEVTSGGSSEYDTYECEEGYEDQYCTRLMEDLYDWGLSAQTIEEVRDVFGWSGLESLWNGR